MKIQVQISEIDNGWLIAGQILNPLTKQPEPRAIFAEDTFEVFKVLKSFLPVQSPRVVSK